MISYIHRAEQETGNHCKVYMDLAGPKVRIESVLLRYGEARVMPGEQIFLVSGSISTYPEEYKAISSSPAVSLKSLNTWSRPSSPHR